ncbi:LysR family transcriptional regulator [Peredibacter starrii]|uniref:LysR family transcriptional regulator n=1 Tax=Peredibacter starrii TaxID=28202 RepID=A0AAX4HU97_9BACT|nr:LysR family transcriptional regulator [Peredibacter starrii]WPU66519.1 LysR family transcriptional regulator [Peredibacter starrii]
MDLNSVSMFVRVVQLGSFSKAGVELGVPKSTISKKIAELEVHLQTTLLRRTTRSLQLTESGRTFFEQASKSLSELKSAEVYAQEANLEPAGVLRVTAVADFATQVISPILAGFLKKYPKIKLELVQTDKVLDLVNDNIDVAVRIGKLTDSNLKSRKLGKHRYQMMASPAYLKSCPPLNSPQDLKNHTCLVFAPRSDFRVWNLKTDRYKASIDVNGQFVSSSASAVRMLAIEGAGIALLPVPTCVSELESGKLKIVLPSWELEEANVHFVYQKLEFTPLKVTAFLDYVGERIKPMLQY